MPSLKDLYPELETDYSEGFDIKGVEIPAHFMKEIYERIPPDELTVKQLINECLAFGIMKRDEDSCLQEWAKEEAQEYGRMGRRKADAGFKVFWDSIQHDASLIWKRNPALSASQVAEKIAGDMKNLAPEYRRSARTIRDRIKKPKKT